MPGPTSISARDAAGTFQLTRAHRVFLGLGDSVVSPANVPMSSSVEIQFIRQVFLFVHPLLTAGGAYRSGPLFGVRDASSLTIAFAAHGGYWTTPPQADEVFRLDSAYILGWADALRAALPQCLDWIGHWIVFPNSQFPSEEEQAVFIAKAETLGLTDRRHVLVFFGFTDGQAQARVSYTRTDDDLAEELE